jgi:cytochrome P450
MLEMIKDRKSSEKAERHDLFSNLLDANNADRNEERLTDRELMGAFFENFMSLGS